MRHAKTLLIGLLAAASVASATDLSLYPNFAEVRMPVSVQGQSYTFSLPQNAWSQVVPGSVDLQGVSVAQAVQGSQGSWLASLEGKTVTLIEDGKKEPVTLVRAQDILIRDAAGQYRNVPYSELALPSLPPLNPTANAQGVTFQLSGNGPAVLSYLTRAVGWSPRYTLKLSADGAASLSALADIRNGGDQTIQVDKTDLIAGEVQLESGGVMPYAARSDMALAAAAPAPKINAVGELRGLYQYALSTPFTLPANSTVSLPFLQPKVSFERYAVLNTGFDTQGGSGKLDRGYRVTSDVLLPAGVMTVRDSGRLVGQTSISDTSAKDPITFDLGSDPDEGYTRTVKVLSQDKNGASYSVTYTLSNSKDRPLRAEITEGIGNVASVQGATQIPNGVMLKANLPAHGKVTLTYSVTVKYQ